MKLRVAAESRHGVSEDDAPARSLAPHEEDPAAEGLPAAAVQDRRGRQLPVVYLPMLALLVVIAASMGLSSTTPTGWSRR
jgi:hypothetical protein